MRGEFVRLVENFNREQKLREDIDSSVARRISKLIQDVRFAMVDGSPTAILPRNLSEPIKVEVVSKDSASITQEVEQVKASIENQINNNLGLKQIKKPEIKINKDPGVISKVASFLGFGDDEPKKKTDELGQRFQDARKVLLIFKKELEKDFEKIPEEKRPKSEDIVTNIMQSQYDLVYAFILQNIDFVTKEGRVLDQLEQKIGFLKSRFDKNVVFKSKTANPKTNKHDIKIYPNKSAFKTFILAKKQDFFKDYIRVENFSEYLKLLDILKPEQDDKETSPQDSQQTA
jgi:hypothetical protein